VHIFGLKRWCDLFTPRQLLALGTFVRHTRAMGNQPSVDEDWKKAISAYLAQTLDFVANRSSTICSWTMTRETIRGTFARFALPFVWDFAEAAPLEKGSGGYGGALDWVARYIEHAASAAAARDSQILLASATNGHAHTNLADIVLTDPPYYGAIPYSDLMDFFYVWLRRTLHGLSHLLKPIAASVFAGFEGRTGRFRTTNRDRRRRHSPHL
jgi:putative DNA methylase